MERCLLLDVPSGALQAVLNNLSPADHASLREVSRSVCERTTAHIPCISLLLTDNTDLLQQWHQATRSLQHVSNIHVHVVCDITAEVFDAAMQLLSERTRVRELHLLDVPKPHRHLISRRASVDTLLPLKHILPSLQTLVIRGIAMPDLVGDLRQLAAAAAVTTQGWKLQSLTCHAYGYVTKEALCRSTSHVSCSWSEFSRVTLQLPLAFPLLQHLNWKVSVLKHDLHGAVEGQQQAAELVTEEVVKCAVTTAVARAMLQLKCLEVLTISKIPDVWGVDTESSYSTAAALNALLDQGGLLHSVSPAATAAAIKTLDDYGCWLLQHHPNLRQLYVRAESLNWADCGMSWQRQQQQQQLPCQRISSRDEAQNSCKAAELVDLGVWCKKHTMQDVDVARGSLVPAAPEVDNDDSSSDRPQHPDFNQCLSHSSSRPASYLLDHISSCKLKINGHNIEARLNLLGAMKSLKHLEVDKRYLMDNTCSIQADVSLAISAAAAIPGLQSLSLIHYGVRCDATRVRMTNDLLLPLTAAAGGPGSSLTKLKLSGNFVSASTACSAGDAATVAAATACDAPWVSGRPWYDALSQLNGLQELSICSHNYGGQLLDLPVECLPAGLKVLEGNWLRIIMGAAASATAASDGLGGCSINAWLKLLPCTVQATQEASVLCPCLQTLTLSGCHLSSPSILASNQLQNLIVCGSSWSGGWAAAAAAWPNVNQLLWEYPYTDNSDSNVALSKRNPKTLTSWESRALMELNLSETLWDVFDVFKYLKSFNVHHWFGVDCWQLFVDKCQVDLQQLQQSGRAYVWQSTTHNALLVRCSNIGSSRPQQELTVTQQALEDAGAINRVDDVVHNSPLLLVMRLTIASVTALVTMVLIRPVLERMRWW